MPFSVIATAGRRGTPRAIDADLALFGITVGGASTVAVSLRRCFALASQGPACGRRWRLTELGIDADAAELSLALSCSYGIHQALSSSSMASNGSARTTSSPENAFASDQRLFSN